MQAEVDQFRDISDQAVIDKDIATILKALWEDPGIQTAYANRHRFQLNDSAA